MSTSQISADPISNSPPGHRSTGRPPALTVGRLKVFPPVLQAPMSAITNLPMRTLAEEHGCGLTLTEWVPAAGLAAGNAATLARIAPSDHGRPFGVQIFGRDPRAMYRAASVAASKGPALVDINMGCPGKKTRSGSCGAALMREPELAAEIVQAVREGVAGRAAVSVKMRAGWDDTTRNAPEFAQRMARAGAEMVTVHGRTRQQRYAGTVDLAIIRRVKASVDIPVVANGDIVDLESMRQTFALTGADGVMLGRAALGNPWIFRQLAAWWHNGAAGPPPSPRERVAMYLRHLLLCPGILTDRGTVIEMRKFAGWYLAGIPNAETLRRAINHAEDMRTIQQLLQGYRPETRGRSPVGTESFDVEPIR